MWMGRAAADYGCCHLKSNSCRPHAKREKSTTKVYVESVPQAKSSLFICLPYHGVLIIALISDHLALMCFEF